MIAPPLLRRVLRAALLAVLAGGVACVWGWLSAPRDFYAAWLAAFFFWLSMPLGALALLLIWDLTGGRWEPLARLPLGAMAATMPLFVFFFVPVIVGLTSIYPWTHADVAAGLGNRWYLNTSFFYIRAGLYALIWNGFAAWRLLRPPGALPWVSAIGVLLLGFSVTFASIDWIMSTEPHWFSSIYGMVTGSAQFITALSCGLVLITAAAPPPGPLRDRFTSGLSVLAMILLAVVIFWAYTSFCQWLIIWEENLRTEITWYIERWPGGWSWVIEVLCVVQFGVPLVALVWTPAKRSPRLVQAVALLLVVTNLLHVWWLLLPGLHGISFSWLDPLVALGMGGLWLAALSLLLLRFGAPAANPAARVAHA